MVDGSRILSGSIRPVHLPVQFAAPGDDPTDVRQAAELSFHELVRDVRRVFGHTSLIASGAAVPPLRS